MANSEDSASSIRQLFQQAKQLPANAQREFLDRHCHDDSQRQELEQLLRAAEARGPEMLDEAMQIVSHSLVSLPAEQLTSEAERALEVTLRPQIPGFELGEPLGSGGMGIVYRAQQLQPLEREVAIKVIKPGYGLGPSAHAFSHRAKGVGAYVTPQHRSGLRSRFVAPGTPLHCDGIDRRAEHCHLL